MTISLKIGNTGEVIPVNDLNDQVTNTELINQLTANKMVPDVPGHAYRLIDKNNQPIVKTATLKDLGIKDGDEVSVDFDDGIITDITTGQTFKGQAFPEFMQELKQEEDALKNLEN